MKMDGHSAQERIAIEKFGSRWLSLDGALDQAPYAGALLSEFHRSLAAAPLGCAGVAFNINMGIDGYLSRDDALKLYELAYFSAGDVLELGTHYGLSTSIIAQALEDRGTGSVETVDIDNQTTDLARYMLDGLPGHERIRFTLKDATARMDELVATGSRFGFIFIDHWHGYEATADAAARCAQLLLPGGLVQFHDFLNPENLDPDHVYGVYQAVLDTIAADCRFSLEGYSGCTVVFRYRDHQS